MSKLLDRSRMNLNRLTQIERWKPGRRAALFAILCSAAMISSAQQVKITEYSLPEGLTAPQGITAGPDSTLWFTSAGGVSRMTTAGVVTDTWPVDSIIAAIPWAYGARLGNIITGPDGALWFDLTHSQVMQNGSFGTIGRITTTGVIAHFGGIRAPSLTVGPDGAIWFAEASSCAGGSGCLYSGQPIGRFTTTGAFSDFPLPGGMNESARSITSGPGRALWFTSTNGTIGKITTAGAITEYAISTEYLSLGDIAAGPDGALWFTLGSTNQIGRITTNGAVTLYTIPTADAGPSSITSGPDGALWFVEVSAKQIGRITTAGAITEYPIPTSSSWVPKITAGPDGALWFTESTANKIGRISLAGQSLNMGYTGPLPSGVVGVPYTPYAQLFTATGGTAPYSWSATGLPPGMTLLSSGDLIGTPVASGTFKVTVSFQDSSSPKLTAAQTLSIYIQAGGPLTILKPSALPGGTVGAPYSYGLTATGGWAPYTWSVLGDLPRGLSLNAGNGLISGTPTAPGNSNFTIQVIDRSFATTLLGLSLNVDAAGSGGPTPITRSGTLAQVASGGGWASSVYIFNPSAVANYVTVNFRAHDGTPLLLPLAVTVNGGSLSLDAASLSLNIAPHGTALIESSSASGTEASGWAEVLSSTPVQGYEVFHFTSPAGIQAEGTVPLETTFQPSFQLPYDNKNGFQTSLALANLNTAASTKVDATIWDENGSQLAVQTIEVRAGGYVSLMLTDLLPSTTANRGVIQFRSASGGNITGLGLRVSPLGGLTSIPTSPSVE